jgi:uncharacterized protein YceK
MKNLLLCGLALILLSGCAGLPTQDDSQLSAAMAVAEAAVNAYAAQSGANPKAVTELRALLAAAQAALQAAEASGSSGDEAAANAAVAALVAYAAQVQSTTVTVNALPSPDH